MQNAMQSRTKLPEFKAVMYDLSEDYDEEDIETAPQERDPKKINE